MYKDLFGSGISCLIQLHIAEVEQDIDGDLDEVQEIERPAEEKDPTAASVREQNEILGNAEDVADPDEDLKLQALALGSPGLPGLVYGQRPAQAEANDHKGFQ